MSALPRTLAEKPLAFSQNISEEARLVRDALSERGLEIESFASSRNDPRCRND